MNGLVKVWKKGRMETGRTISFCSVVLEGNKSRRKNISFNKNVLFFEEGRVYVRDNALFTLVHE